MHDVRPLCTSLGGTAQTAALARAEHPVAVAVLPLGAWLEPALALPLIEIALDVTIRTPVSVSSPACAVVRGLIGQRLRDLRCLTGASTCSGCPVAAACDYGRIFEGGSPHPFWLQGIPATTELDPGAQLAARLYLAAPVHTVAQYLDVTLRDAFRALDSDAVLSASRVRALTLGECCDARGVPTARGRAAPPPHRDAAVAAGRRGALPGAVSRGAVAGALGPGRHPWSSSRFSHRQHQRMPLEGLQGDAVVHGPNLAALAPLLRALTVTSVGKSTSLGLGTLRVGTP